MNGLTDEEQKTLNTLKLKKLRHDYEEDKKKRDKKFKGYLFWCSEGCGFVRRDHRCEQWSNLTYLSPALITAIEKRCRAKGATE